MLSSVQFNFCPRCGVESLSCKDNKALVCNNCDFVYYFNAASAVGCLLETERGLILVKRARDPGKGTLDLPGGFCDYDESLEDALIREVREELGIVINNITYYASFPNLYEFGGVLYHTLDSFFTAYAKDVSSIQMDSEVDGFIFVKRDSFDPSQVVFPSVRKALYRYFDINE